MLNFKGTSEEKMSSGRTVNPIWMLGIFVSGIAAGVLMLGSLSSTGYISEYAVNQGFVFKGGGIVSSTANAALSSLILLAALYLSGFSAIAQPVQFLLLFARGVAVGLSVSNYYAESGFGGFIVSAVLIAPFAVISLLPLLLGAREAFRLSCAIASGLTKKSEAPFCIGFGMYNIRFAVLFLLLAAICLLQGLLTALLSGILG